MGGSASPFPAKGDLEGVSADEVQCGFAHVVAVGIYRRRLFTWGLGEGGRLGHGDERSEVEPKLVRTVPRQEVVRVTCGPRSTAAILACPKTFNEPTDPEHRVASEQTTSWHEGGPAQRDRRRAGRRSSSNPILRLANTL